MLFRSRLSFYHYTSKTEESKRQNTKNLQKRKKCLQNLELYARITFASGDGGMADALDSGSSGSNPVRVQVPFSAFCCTRKNP